jgi:hypothetical protein
MRHGVLGTGMVGQAIATKLVALGNETMMGSRRAGCGVWRGGVQLHRECRLARGPQAVGPENMRAKVLIDVAKDDVRLFTLPRAY